MCANTNSRTRARTLIVEAVDAVNGCALVVTTQDEEVFGVLDFVRQQQTNGLQALLSAVDVVTAETPGSNIVVSRVHAGAAMPEKRQQRTRGTGSWRLGESRRTQTGATSRSTVRGYRLLIAHINYVSFVLLGC